MGKSEKNKWLYGNGLEKKIKKVKKIVDGKRAIVIVLDS